MHAVLLGAFKGYAGTGKLGEPVYVISLDAKSLFYIRTHLLAPGLRAEDASL